MDETQPIKQTTFKSLLLKQLFIAIALGLLITTPIISIPAYLFLNHSIKTDISQVEGTSYEAINNHLASGWQKQNIDQVYRDIRKSIPSASLFLQKAPAYLDKDDDVLSPNSPMNIEFLRLISKVEETERLVVESNFVNKTISAAIPIKFKADCLICHAAAVNTGEVYEGALGGTMVMQVPMTVERISTVSTIFFFLLFFVVFTLISAIVTNRLIQGKLLTPLEELDRRVKRLRLTSHERNIDWQRTQQELVEVDHIDESISHHIEIIKAVYDKLDVLVVTEHETGLFHRDRFNEVLQYELFRSRRYKHPFSLILVKLESVRILNSSAKNLEEEQPGSKYLTFGQILHNDTRASDMSFRLEEKIFAIVAPVTDEAGAKTMEHDIYKRLISTELDKDEERTSVQPEYEFTIKIGSASLEGGEQIDGKALLKVAINNLKACESRTGLYPPQLNQDS